MRIELIHPLVVHFPLALLLIGVTVRLICFLFRRKNAYRYLLISSWVMLFFGVCFAWIAVLAGEFAEDIVRKWLCKPEILDQHKDFAYTAASLFSFALILDLAKAWAKRFFISSRFLSRALTTLCALLFLSGASILICVGSFGANLVYEQGAAVEKKCS